MAIMRTLIVVAHADDETLCAGSVLLGNPEECLVLHCTDSAPRDLEYARRAGFASREEYAAARRQEFMEAMCRAGVPEGNCLRLEIPDQEAVLRVSEIANAVDEVCAEHGIERILTHAYEGGHPDHDAVAYAVQQTEFSNVWEMPLYNGAGGKFVTRTLLPHPGASGMVNEVALSAEQQSAKEAMLQCFRSQKEIVDRFPNDREVYRMAPVYDFSRPPHEGELYYDGRRMGWKSKDWRAVIAGGEY